VIASGASARADESDAGAMSTPVVGISMVAAPMFGTEASTGNGWNEVVARIDNPSGATQKGVLELEMSTTFGGEGSTAALAPFAVPAGRTAMVALPMRGFSPYYAPQVVVTAKSENGTKLESVSVSVSGGVTPLLVEIAQPARLGVALRGWPVGVTWDPASTTRGGSGLTTGVPTFDRTTGDPILPTRAAGYGATTLVLVSSERLATLDEARRGALVDWVKSGGSMAIFVTRPEDLRSPLTASLVGGAVSRVAAPARLFSLPAYKKPAAAGLGNTGDDDEEGAAPSTPPSPTTTPKAIRTGPSHDVRGRLAGYEGGRLAPSDVGASAPCGLGEVHLLAFDPTTAPGLDDAWVQTRMIDLVARAWDRRARVALPVGGGDRGVSRIDEVRRALDPNENFRLGLAISAVLLVLYAIVVGPVVFTRASKSGSPLLPLKWVPIASAAAFLSIVLVGWGIKGWRGRARHLTLLEAGTGEGRMAMRSYRGFFARETRSLTIASRVPGAVLMATSTDARTQAGTLRVERDGTTLTDLTSLPWETVVVREDGMMDLRGGVVVRAATGGNVVVENHSGHVLKDVLVHAPKTTEVTYFATIDDGETVDLPRGRRVTGIGGSSAGFGTYSVHELGAESVQYALTGREGKRFSEAWAPIEAAAGAGIDWWPEDAPALVAEVAGMPKAAQDAGLLLESERVLVHVVGEASR
jgi:hypothetical protein